MRNITQVNTKLQYKDFIYKLNYIIADHHNWQGRFTAWHDEQVLNDFFDKEFPKYVNILVHILIYDKLHFIEKLKPIIKTFLLDNIKYIDFNLYESNSFNRQFFKEYIYDSNVILSDPELFIWSIKFILYDEQTEQSLMIYVDTFINNHLLTDNQVDKLFDFIAQYQINVSSKFIHRYIKYFSTPVRGYLLYIHNSNLFKCHSDIIDKIKRLKDQHIENNYKEIYDDKQHYRICI